MEYFNYLQSQSIEEKIVGIIQCQKYLQENLQQNIDFNCNEYLEILINTATPKFLIQMLHTKFQGPNFTIQNVAISLLEIICEKHPSLLQNFSNFCFELFQLSFQENKYNKRLFDLAMVIRGLSKLDSLLQLMFVKTLEFVCSNSLDSLAAFGGLIEIASNLNQHMSLSSQHSKQLRDVLVQGLKSSAREKYRDNFFIAVMVFLSRLDPVWTQDQKFIMFLVSLICGEYRLLLQELTTLAEHTEETSSNLEIIDQRIDRCEKLLCVCYEIFDLFFSLLVGEMSEVNGSWHNLLATTLQLIQKVI